MSDSLRPHEPQHARPPCPPPTPGLHPNPCSSSRWCHPTISSSAIPFSFCPQSFPASGSSQMSQLFASGSQNTRVSTSTLVLPVNTQDWSLLGWTGIIDISPGNLDSSLKMDKTGTSLVVQWLRIPLVMQRTLVWSLILENPTRHGATKPVCPRAYVPHKRDHHYAKPHSTTTG